MQVRPAVLAAAPPLAAQGERELARPTSLVRIDGDVSDSAWALVEPLPLTLYAPAFRGRPEERTEIRVACDDQYLYASGRFYDSRPGEIRISSLCRDRWSGDDNFAPFVDGFNDNETRLWFGTGGRQDERLGVTLRLRYNCSEGSDLWLVYDEGFNTERDAGPGEPRLPLSQSRVLRVKLTRTFTS